MRRIEAHSKVYGNWWNAHVNASHPTSSLPVAGLPLEWWEVNAHAFFTVLILYILLAFVGGLYLFHSFLACSCITTYEFMRSDRIDYLKGTRDFDLPYSRGLGGNLKFFFFQLIL